MEVVKSGYIYKKKLVSPLTKNRISP